MQILLVWKSKYNPIKRDIVHQSKCNGGLGLMNVLYKAQSILISTFLKQFLNSQENHSFLKYYCSLRLNPLFNIRELPRNVSYVCPKYLDNLVHLTRKLIHIPKFPNVNSRDIYSLFLTEVQLPGNQTLAINWKISWKHLTFAYMDIHERELMFKLLHNIITTKKRLYQIKRTDSPLCEVWHVNEDSKHMFSECIKLSLLNTYFKNLLRSLCGIECGNIIKTLHLDIKGQSKKDTNTAIILTSSYISTVWFNRASRVQIQPSLYQTSILRHKVMLSMILNQKMCKIFSEKYCDIENHL